MGQPHTWGDLFEPGVTSFDIIIDDASHITEDQLKVFQYLFQRVRKGGLYVIEDVTNWGQLRQEYPFEMWDMRFIGSSDSVLLIARR